MTAQQNTVKLSRRDLKFNADLIKGRIAEAIIEQLFLTHHYNVFRYGMENYLPSIMGILNKDSEVGRQIRRMPDFVVHNKDTNEVFFIEVKFRSGESFNLSNLAHAYHKNTHIILLSRTHIKCLTVEELEAGKEISTNCKNYLGYRKEFDLDKNIVIEFCKLAERFLDNV